MENSYKIILENPTWEFIVVAFSEEKAIKKLLPYLDQLVPKDGFTTMAISAKESVEKSNYSIELYIGFVIS